MVRYHLITLLLIANSSFAQHNDNTSFPLNSFAEYFLGTWYSDPKACVGMGKASREYKWILDSAFLYSLTFAEFESNGKVEDIHKDWSILSYDKGKARLTLREFHSEDYVITYINTNIPQKLDTIVFSANQIDNNPEGWKARLTIYIIDEKSFDEFFDLAEPGEEFKNYVKGRWIKQ